MPSIKIFDNITESEQIKMRECFQTKQKKFTAGSNLSAHRGSEQRLGIMLSGEADLVRFDYDGYRNIIEHISTGDVFGDIIMQADGADELAVVCDRKCEVLFIDYINIIKRCPNACKCHSTLVDNLLKIIADKMQSLRAHLEVLSQRTLRTKLLTYFNKISKQSKSNTFTLPFTLSDLADYLYVDRSAMLREMKKLREENKISSRGRKITLK